MLHHVPKLVGHIGLKLNVVVVYKFLRFILLFSAGVLCLFNADYHNCLEFLLPLSRVLLVYFSEFASWLSF